MIDRKTGEKTRSRFKTLTLKELSAVDNPAQEGARFTIMKRADDDHKDDATKALYDFNEIADIVREMHKQTPDIVSKLDALIKAGSSGDDEKDMQMTDAEKIADLEKKVADLTAERDTIKADVEKKDGEIVILKSAATEEILKVGETEVRKSVVGEAQFAISRRSRPRSSRRARKHPPPSSKSAPMMNSAMCRAPRPRRLSSSRLYPTCRKLFASRSRRS